MKILKLLSSLLPFIIYLAFFQFQSISFSNEAVDIWNIEKKVIEENNVEENLELENIMVQPVDNLNDEILRDENLTKSEISLVGIYDPEEYSLTIDMWSNSDGNNIKSILNRIDQENLSEDSISILDIALLTNSYSPRFNISENEFNNFKINYLIKKRDFKQIENFINLNPNLEENKKLIKFYADFFLTNSNIDKACSILLNKNLFNDNYLIKFKIYCLIHDNNKEEAQLIYDLQVENGFDDIFFEKKFNILMNYQNENNENVSEKNILDFHLSHRTSKNFNFIPSETTDQIIWDYLSSSNLLEDVNLIDLDNEEKIKVVEKATHQKNYKEKDLLNLYKRFQFNINQLINAQNNYELLPSYEGRALLYQKLLLSKDINEILNLTSKLKSSFEADGISEAFSSELEKFLNNIKKEDVPSNFTTFYEKYAANEILNKDKKIKFNNKVIHQSKLINHFLEKQNNNKTENDLEDILKKTKKNKKYFVSKKDIILLESLKSDGINFPKKYENMYEENSEIPNDIQAYIENSESGMMLLRLVELIGQDEVLILDIDTIGFIISALNQMNMDVIRNKIILEIMPSRV
tara:strand:+ start:601 stop:2340 length:1740 start_codon:yes stop_codon:yes gene_type:complete